MKQKILLLGGSGLVGQAIMKALNQEYQIIPTAGHHTPEHGYCLTTEEPGKLAELLEKEQPDLVISSLVGEYPAQMRFHQVLADWVADREKRLLYLSTANVFDGNLTQPWSEEDTPMPQSDYGKFKWDCEQMLSQKLGDRLIVFRLAAVWSQDCPRVQQLKLHSQNREPHPTFSSYQINVTLAEQIGAYARYVLDNQLHGCFHVATKDLVQYSAFEKMVCQALGMEPPQFAEKTGAEQVIFAILPGRREIPDQLQLTVADVLAALKEGGQ